MHHQGQTNKINHDDHHDQKEGPTEYFSSLCAVSLNTNCYFSLRVMLQTYSMATYDHLSVLNLHLDVADLYSLQDFA